MIPEERFKLSLYGRDWKCEKRTCRKQNPKGRFECEGCGAAMPTELLGNDLIFRKFKRVKASPKVKMLKYVLQNIPLVEEGQDMLTLIENELEKMGESR